MHNLENIIFSCNKSLLLCCRASLETGLECKACLLAMQVNNGTEWLHLGGDINTFLPIVTEHSQSAATSDLTLEMAMDMVKEKIGK